MCSCRSNPNHKGNVAELAIAKEAASLGLSVCAPLTEHERYDLIIGLAGRLLRVQCKWGRMEGDVEAAADEKRTARVITLGEEISAWGCSSAGRALAWHARGQGFESPQLHHLGLT